MVAQQLLSSVNAIVSNCKVDRVQFAIYTVARKVQRSSKSYFIVELKMVGDCQQHVFCRRMFQTSPAMNVMTILAVAFACCIALVSGNCKRVFEF